MRNPFHRKSTWEKMQEDMLELATKKNAIRSGVVAAGAAVGVTAVSSAISSMRKKKADAH
jgi:hypothetical protein